MRLAASNLSLGNYFLSNYYYYWFIYFKFIRKYIYFPGSHNGNGGNAGNGKGNNKYDNHPHHLPTIWQASKKQHNQILRPSLLPYLNLWIFRAKESLKAFLAVFFKNSIKFKNNTTNWKKKSNQNLLSFYNVVRNHKYSVLIQPSLKSLPTPPKIYKKETNRIS